MPRSRRACRVSAVGTRRCSCGLVVGQEVPHPGTEMISVPRCTLSTFFVPAPQTSSLLCAPETPPPRLTHSLGAASLLESFCSQLIPTSLG